MAAGTHPFPFRTRQLSPPAPMVLGGHSPGRVGRRRVHSKTMPARKRGGHRRVSHVSDGRQYPSPPNDWIHSVAERPRRRRERRQRRRAPAGRRAPQREEAARPRASRAAGRDEQRLASNREPQTSRRRSRPGPRERPGRRGPANVRDGRGVRRQERTNLAAKGTGKRPVKDMTGSSATGPSGRDHEPRGATADDKRTDDRARPAKPHRSGIQYPSRKTGAPAEPEPDRIRRPGARCCARSRAAGPAGEEDPTRHPAKSGTTAVPPAGAARSEAGDELARIAGRNASRAQADLARAAEAYTSGRERDAARSCGRCATPTRTRPRSGAARAGPLPARAVPRRVAQGAHRVRRPQGLGRTASRPHGLVARPTPLRQGRGALGGARAVVAVGRAGDRGPHRARRRTGRQRPRAGGDPDAGAARPTT